ncbi:hypothetical protein [Rugosimonospora africana]|uniref:Uncharacterized protein n=1 Tax=Rugosimonospora africana TaxID=556532 RepID=A0A8J3QWG5_9ACTN|nr:hypothetical protein [Rugosimonospora africana]GIH17075.1 hypothetical protein Raf01_52470 [Rugosimonospora africana]
MSSIPCPVLGAGTATIDPPAAVDVPLDRVRRVWQLEDAIADMVDRLSKAERQFAYTSGGDDAVHERWYRACCRRRRAVRRLVATLAREATR